MGNVETTEGNETTHTTFHSECSDRELFKSKDKKKDKKKDKERGYKTFEPMETHSEDDDERGKKKRNSIFSRKSKTPKEKHKDKDKEPPADEKHREKEMKAEKKRSKSKEREAKKERTRSKEREKFGRKKAHTISTVPATKPAQSVEVKPVFGIPLAEAVEHSKMYDGIELPKIVRECIDFIEEHGMSHAGIYRLSGVKSKVELLRGCYNRNEEVDLRGQDPNNVSSLLKQYLRELPEPPLTKTLGPKLEEAAAIADIKVRLPTFQRLLQLLPKCNYALLSWLVVHLAHVLQNEAETKMTIQNISIVMCPTLHISHRVLNLLFTNWKTLFKGVQIKRCPKPLKWDATENRLELPENPAALEEELQRQEAILAKMHDDLNKGLADKSTEEHLWEVQRIVTQLKRKLRVSRRISETRIAAIEKEKEREKEKEKEKEREKEKHKEMEKAKEAKAVGEQDAQKTKEETEDIQTEEIKTEQEETGQDKEEVKSADRLSQDRTPKKRQAPRAPADVQPSADEETPAKTAEPEDIPQVEIEIEETEEDAVFVETAEEDVKEVEDAEEAMKIDEAKKLEDENLEMIRLLLLSQAEVLAEQEELQAIHTELLKRIEAEKQEVARLKEEIAEAHSQAHHRSYSVDSTDSLMSSESSTDSDDDDDTELQAILNKLIRENQELERKNTQLSHDIHNEREACVELKVQIKLRQHPYYQMEPSSIQSVKDVQARERELESFVKTEREVESDSEVVVTSGEVKRGRRKSQSNPNVAGPMTLVTGTRQETDIEKERSGASGGEKAKDAPRARRLERETSV
ncbi:ralA-binding protein 1-like isoform X2 [Patiria miniata]|uniref:Rho-GAP domain-containing protein n=1 Tax=Patiria miniata TaxID=46514 RepID=A0A914A3E0_PATMI|nr:ralA-binding protein 1-like isoform X2 [Patiria miniata]